MHKPARNSSNRASDKQTVRMLYRDDRRAMGVDSGADWGRSGTRGPQEVGRGDTVGGSPDGSLPLHLLQRAQTHRRRCRRSSQQHRRPLQLSAAGGASEGSTLRLRGQRGARCLRGAQRCLCSLAVLESTGTLLNPRRRARRWRPPAGRARTWRAFLLRDDATSAPAGARQKWFYNFANPALSRNGAVETMSARRLPCWGARTARTTAKLVLGSGAVVGLASAADHAAKCGDARLDWVSTGVRLGRSCWLAAIMTVPSPADPSLWIAG